MSLVLCFLFLLSIVSSSWSCRSSLPTKHGIPGREKGYFGWGVDLLDSTDPRPFPYNQQDFSYCPLNGLQGDGVHVYILDTGFDFASNIDDGGSLFNYDSILPDFDCCFSPGDTVPFCQDDFGHGTWVAGIVASNIYGVAPGVTLHIYKITDAFHLVPTLVENIYQGLTHLSQHDPPVGSIIVSTWGVLDYKNETISNLIQYMIRVQKLTFVVAAGNMGIDACRGFPANVPGVLVVGAIDDHLSKPSFSNFGSCVDIFGPGKDIITTDIGVGKTRRITGTSIATPAVAGVLAIKRQLLGSDASLRELLDGSIRRDILYGIGDESPNKLIYIGGGDITNNNGEKMKINFLILLCILFILST